MNKKKISIQKKKDTLHIFEASNDLREQFLVSLELVTNTSPLFTDSASII